MRVMGLDYGSKTVGVALTDSLGITVQPRETIVRKEENKLRRTLARIEEIVQTEAVDEIVLGCPLNMDGSAGERVEKTLAFQALIERRTGLPVCLWDERLTTVEADEVLEECGVPKRERKQYIDQVAAVLILRGYLEQKERASL